MTDTKKERVRTKNPNYSRFYEFDSKKCCICSECPAKNGSGTWTDVAKSNLGLAVHTNWERESNSIKVVYICESPSNRETSHALPSVGTTGQGIYKKEYNGTLIDYWLDTLDVEIYRTNIVRCQADAGLQKSIEANKKNKRVHEAFKHCQTHLWIELNKILQNHATNGAGKIRFVLAVGKEFSKEIEKSKAFINELARSTNDFTIEINDHPRTIR